MYPNGFAYVFRLTVVLTAIWFGTGSAQLTASASSASAIIVQTDPNVPQAPRTRELTIKLFGKSLHFRIDIGMLGFMIILVLAILLLTAALLARIARHRTKQALVINRKLQEEITQRKLAEDEVKKLNAALEIRVADRTAQLQAANKELEAFSYSVSHDLRRPLRHINGFSQALLEDCAHKLDEAGKGYLQEVCRASHEMALLIDDLLQLARVTRSEMRCEVVDLTNVARAVMAELQKRDEGRIVAVTIEEGLFTHGDKGLLRVLLSNLLGNAWKFTTKREHAEIAFGQEHKDGEQVYVVCDNGAGFDMTYVDKLFGAFQRLHSVGEFEGTGIGLATVQRIVHRHGGRVWAAGKMNEGASFYFTLPDFKEMTHGE